MKFPVLKNIEYLDIMKNKQTLRSYKTKELEGLSWRELQSLVGKEFGQGVFRYTLKVNNENKIFNGSIRAIGLMPREEKTNDSKLISEIDSLKRKIDNAGQGSGISFDLLISVTKQSYETQINFLNQQIQQKENYITELKAEIKSLENELNQADDIIEDLKAKTGINQYLEIAQTFLKSKLGNTKPIQSLKDSNPDDIPQKILDLLGAVQWNEVDQKIVDEIVFWLNQFVTKLPLKGQS